MASLVAYGTFHPQLKLTIHSCWGRHSKEEDEEEKKKTKSLERQMDPHTNLAAQQLTLFNSIVVGRLMPYCN